jgi:beta-phosphoglucomutase-like phosphatase (HAD superfamily)
MQLEIDIKELGPNALLDDFLIMKKTDDGRFVYGKDGIKAILGTRDNKIEFVFFENHILGHVKSALGYPAYYPLHPVDIKKPVKAVLMDLDGTSVHSEHFWIWIIQRTVASLLEDPKFELEEADIPFVSGHSVSEHLQHCIDKYCPEKTVEKARRLYFKHTHHEMNEIMEGRGKADAFTPAPGIKEFLLELKTRKIKIGLVTSGLYEKAWPEILSAFRTLGMGDPKDFYDAIITAGFPMRDGSAGTLGELSPKPHPWLYSEVSRVGLGIPFESRHHVIGIEDSGAGVASIRLAGFAVIGFANGNIIESGTKGLCSHYCEKFAEILELID